MKRHLILSMVILTMVGIPAVAQQAIGGGQEIISPEIHEKGTVTFQLQAPHAEVVKLTGDWMPAEGWVPGSVVMEKDENGTWRYTTKALTKLRQCLCLSNVLSLAI